MLKRIFKILIFFNILFAVGLAKAEDIPLPAEEAFVFSAYLEKPARLIIEWQVAPGYYLYRDKLYLRAEPVSALKKDQIKWPASKNKLDPIRGSFRAYEGHVHLVLPLSQALEQERSFTIQYQGCSQSGFCYAPVKKRLDLHYPFSAEGLKGAPLLIVSEASAKSSSIKTVSRASNLLIDQGATQTFLSEHNFIMSILCFLGLGLLLAFTPCILPMIPILSSIIVGQKKLTTRKAFRLSLSYVLGMALTYAIAGLAITWVGSSIQIYFQNPWVISGLSAIFILLALSMADLFVLPLPAWQRNLIAWQHGRQGGHYFGVFLMGSLSTLIMSPCVTAPLIGILAYLSETGNLLLGASALFTLGLGMGLPLLLLGFSAGKYLPRTGHWMMIIKKFFAFLLVGMAIAMLSRILPSAVTLFLWASLLIAMAIFLFFVEGLSRLSRYSAYLVGGLFVLYAFILFIGVSLNFTSPFYPFESRFFKTGFV
ncbi:MAG TPA: protein-disulfide reductase DsbD, partial [Gammaproteobacteria bacterium]|nr:protein-disulfide reductase DsbD [Gammaproteobacteria bacterium]